MHTDLALRWWVAMTFSSYVCEFSKQAAHVNSAKSALKSTFHHIKTPERISAYVDARGSYNFINDFPEHREVGSTIPV
ncbi:MAG: hypothetical protein AB8U44_03890 [Aaplasma endosymbiont of Hyalomma asiaticum]